MTRLRWIIVIGLVVAASWASALEAKTTGSHRCAIVDPHANKIVLTKQGSGDTIIRIVAYVDAGDSIAYESWVPRYARRLVTQDKGTTLRMGCAS